MADCDMSMIATLVWSRLGYCAYCMRSAFRSAALAWGATALVAAFTDLPLFYLTVGAFALGLTALWGAHLVVYALKAVATLERRDDNETGNSDGISSIYISRRSAWPMFARVLAATAIGTALPTLAFAACDQQGAQSCFQSESDCLFNRKLNKLACCVETNSCLGRYGCSGYQCSNN